MVVILEFFAQLDLVDGIPQALFDVVLLVGVAAAQTLFELGHTWYIDEDIVAGVEVLVDFLSALQIYV